MAQAVPGTGARHADGRPPQGVAHPGLVAGMAGLVELAPGLCLALFDLPACDASGAAALGRAQIDGTIDGVALPRPVLSTRLALRGGGTRCLVLMRQGTQALAGARLTFTMGGRTAAFVDPDWLQSPWRQRDDLIDGLAPGAGARLVRFLLPNVATLVAPAALGAFTDSMLALLTTLDVARGTLVAACPVGTAGLILGYRVHGPVLPLPARAVALGAKGVAVLSPLTACAEGEGIVHLFLPRADRRDLPDLLLPGDRPVHLCPPAAVPVAQDIADWLDRRPTEVRAWAEGVLRAAAATDPAAAAVLAERAVLPAAAPVLDRVHLAATRGGLLVWADITDRHGLAETVQVDLAGRVARVSVPAGGHLRAFVPWPGAADAQAGHARLRLRGRSGRTLGRAEAPVAAFSGAVPSGFAPDAGPDAGRDAAARSLARAWQDRGAAVPQATVQPCGPATAAAEADPAPPRLTIVVPLTADPDLIRARAALVACEPGAALVEVDCLTADRPSPRMLDLLATLVRTTGVAHRVVRVPDGTAPVDALLAGLRAARAPDVLVLGAAVLPERSGWLAPWIAALDGLSETGVLGGAILAPDGSVDHAGGRLVVPAGAAPRVEMTATGLPEADLPPGPTLRSDLFTVDAVGLTAAGRAAILAAGPCLPDPDLALLPALLRAGAGQVWLGQRFVRYGAAAPADPRLRAAALHLLTDAADGDAAALADAAADDADPDAAPADLSPPCEEAA